MMLFLASFILILAAIACMALGRVAGGRGSCGNCGKPNCPRRGRDLTGTEKWEASNERFTQGS